MKRIREEQSVIWQFSKGRCWYCGYELNPFLSYSVDHIVPRSKGGSDELENLVPCCRSCNSSKGRKVLEQWRSDHVVPKVMDNDWTYDTPIFHFEHVSFLPDWKSDVIKAYRREGGFIVY